MMKSILLPILLLGLALTASAQRLPREMHFSPDGRILYTGGNTPPALYEPSVIRDVRIDFPQPNYWSLLTANYTSETDIPASLTIDGITYDSVGVRFRGNTSYMTIPNSQKKSFSITADFVDSNQTILGYKNLKFNNAHQDPTFMREVLYDRMAARHTPIAKTNFIHLFLNGQDWGVYPNIQSIDKTFLEEYFLSNDGARFRATTGETGGGPGGGGGGPGWGDGTAGMNYLGPDTASYQQYYALKSSDIGNPWQKLVDACAILSTATPANMEEVRAKLDIDKVLWFLAVENIFTDDDSYVMKGKMDYMIYYEPETGRTTPLEYDGNSSFESNLATSWTPFYNVTKPNYPLLNKLLNIPEWRQRYLAHYRTILAETFTVEKANALIDTMDAQIRNLVNADTKKLYPFSQYLSGVPGLKTFVANRRNFLLANGEVAQVAPVITEAPFHNAALEPYSPPVAGESAIVTSRLTSAGGIAEVRLWYATGLVGNFTQVGMRDDGAYPDALAGDGEYAGSIPGFPAGTFVRYYVEAIANNAARSAAYLPAGAEHDVFVYQVDQAVTTTGIVINELLASNSAGDTDEYGDHDDWIEIYNTTATEVDLGGFFLSDDPANPGQWTFPGGTTVPANGYLIVWADGEPDQGPLHATFKLSASGETLILSDASLARTDSVIFGAQIADLGYARVPNGTGPFKIQQTTFMAANDLMPAGNGVVINEILASNIAGVVDEAGDHEDWIELYNNNDQAVDLTGFFISDDASIPDKYVFPAGTILPAHGYMILWADDESAEGPFHAGFKLSANGEVVIFSAPDGQILDNAPFGTQTADVAFARVPNGTGDFVHQGTTFLANNEILSGTADVVLPLSISLYPNPVTDGLWFSAKGLDGEPAVISDQLGRIRWRGSASAAEQEISTGTWSPGLYVLLVRHPMARPVKIIKR